MGNLRRLPETRGTLLTRHVQGEITKDAVYIDAERRFEELEKETKKLHEESKKYAIPYILPLKVC